MWTGHPLRPTTNHRGLQAFLGAPRGPGCLPLASQRLLRPFGAHRARSPPPPSPSARLGGTVVSRPRSAPRSAHSSARGKGTRPVGPGRRSAPSVPPACPPGELSQREPHSPLSPGAPIGLSVPEDAVLDGFTPMQFLVFRWG